MRPPRPAECVCACSPFLCSLPVSPSGALRQSSARSSQPGAPGIVTLPFRTVYGESRNNPATTVPGFVGARLDPVEMVRPGGTGLLRRTILGHRVACGHEPGHHSGNEAHAVRVGCGAAP